MTESPEQYRDRLHIREVLFGGFVVGFVIGFVVGLIVARGIV